MVVFSFNKHDGDGNDDCVMPHRASVSAGETRYQKEGWLTTGEKFECTSGKEKVAGYFAAFIIKTCCIFCGEGNGEEREREDDDMFVLFPPSYFVIYFRRFFLLRNK